MKKFSFLAMMMLFSIVTFAQTCNVDGVHSRLGFKVTRMTISEFQGNFKSYEAKITEGKSGFDGGMIEVKIDTRSINTDNESRDNHLRSADFFDADKYPTITFKSSSIKKLSDKMYSAEGDMTMKGITKKIMLNIKVNGTTVNERNKKEIAGVTITGDFKRSDFGIAAEMPEAVLSDTISLYATGEFSKG